MVAGTVGKQSTDTPASDALIIIISIAIVIIVSIIIILDIKIKIYGGRNLFYKQGQFNRAGQCPTKLEQFHGAGQGRVPGRRGSSAQSQPALMLPVSQHPSLDSGQWTPPSINFFLQLVSGTHLHQYILWNVCLGGRVATPHLQYFSTALHCPPLCPPCVHCAPPFQAMATVKALPAMLCKRLEEYS